MQIRKIAVALALTSLLLGFSQPNAAIANGTTATWKIDTNHSELTFSIRHLVSRVRGEFREWSGTIVADPDDWTSAVVEISVNPNTVDTNNERRDADLKSENHFDVAHFPVITYKSTRVERKGDSVRVFGDLTMHGVTKPVVLDGRFLGTTGPVGKRRAGFEAITTINRQDFNMRWNRAVEGGNLIGDDVKLEIVIAAVQQ